MSSPDWLPRYRSGDPSADTQIKALIEEAGLARNRDLAFEMIVSCLRLVNETTDRGDLKLVNSTLKEIRYALSVFGPYRQVKKLSIFGSARTPRDSQAYEAAASLGESIAEQGWMVITGAGPGIMAAGVEGAGAGNSFGVGIRLPFEEKAAPTIADDPKLVNFKYFFTRKLTFMKESHGFALLPGGFGTLDESFELLTLLQTGKTELAPVVLLDPPGGRYWQGWLDFVTNQLEGQAMISSHDLSFVRLTDSVEDAVDELCNFYRNYDSLRFVGSKLVLRVRAKPSEALIECLNDKFDDIVAAGKIEQASPTVSELRDEDRVDLHRISLQFNRRSYGRLRQLIDELNRADL